MNYNKCYNKLVGCKKNNEKQRKQAKTNNKMSKHINNYMKYK